MDIIMNVAIGGSLGGDEYVPSGSFNYEMYVDYVRVYQTAPVPTAGPTAPTEPSTGIVALLSDTFSVGTASDWRTGSSVNSTVTDLSLSGNSIKQYSNVTQFTVEPSAVLNVSDAYKFQFSVYRTDPYADLKVKLVDFGADGVASGSDNSHHEIVFSQANGNAIGSGQWVPVEVKMTDLTGLSNQSAIGQIVVSSHQAGTTSGSGETIYLDDVFFSPPPVPTAGPNAPNEAARYVQSLFSGNYTDAVSSTFTDGSGSTEDITLSGNTIKKADSGAMTVSPASAIDLSLMQTLQLDVWRTDETAELRLTLTHTDDTEHTIVLSKANGYPAPVVGQWTHFDVPLADFTGLSSASAIDQIKLSSHSGSANSGETLYVDNLYTSKPVPALEVTFATDDSSGFAFTNVVGGTSMMISGTNVPSGGDSPAPLLVKTAGQASVGASFLTLDSGELVSTANGQVSMRVWLQNNDVNARLKLEDVTNGGSVELTSVTGSGKANQWQTVSWDFSSVDHGPTYNKVSVYFDSPNPSGTEYYFFDDVQFYGAG
tara:strand:- start:87 stop:1709 length:1623 start_codon:yes stop_codon:yes gene_type:complete